MATVLTPILSATAGTPRGYSPGIAETYSWVPVEGDALGRPLYAQASYVTNFSDMSIQLSASELSIGAVTIKDNNSGINSDVVEIPGKGYGLQVSVGNTVSISGTVVSTVDPSKGFPITYADSSDLDAFGRLRVSEPKTLVDAKHLYDKLPLLFNEKLSGTSTSTFSANDSMVVMSTNGQNSYVIRQSRYHFNYQPGKSLQALFTGKLHPQAGIIKRMGLYQSLSSAPTVPADGIYLEVTENGPRFCITKTQGYPNSIVIPQSAWNVDKLDGTGISGVTIALSAAQIFVIDYEWLSLGRVRFGFMQSGKTYYAHHVNHINDLDRPYITSPNQPLRYEIVQTGSTPGSMHHICSTVMVEGGEENIGKPISLSDSKVTNIEATRAKVLLAVRLKSAAHDSSVALKAVEVINTGGNPGRYEVILNPTYVSSPFTWIDAENTAVQYSTGGAFVSGGYNLFKSFVPTGVGGSTTQSTLPVPGEIVRLGVDIDDKMDIVVVAGRSFADNALTDMVALMHLLERS